MKWYGWAIILVVIVGLLLYQMLPFDEKLPEKAPVDQYKFEDSSSPASNIEHLKKLDSVKK